MAQAPSLVIRSLEVGSRRVSDEGTLLHCQLCTRSEMANGSGEPTVVMESQSHGILSTFNLSPPVHERAGQAVAL